MHHVMMYILVFANLFSVLNLGTFIVGANGYDILEFKRAAKRKQGALSTDQPAAHLPLVSVVIPAHNEAAVIRRTLDSVRASSYENIEIIVVDDGSTDQTDQMVRDYIMHLPQSSLGHYMAYETGKTETTYRVRSGVGGDQPAAGRRMSLYRRYLRIPSIPIRTVRVRQSNGGKAAAMNNAIAHYVRGELVMCLDADSMIHPRAIERAVPYFRDPKVMGVAANVRVMDGRNWITKVQRFEHMIGYRTKKFYTLANCEFIIGGVASTYRTALVKEIGLYDTDTMTEDIGLSMKLVAHMGNRDHKIVYAADVLAMTEGVQTFRALMRQRYRWKVGSLQNIYKYRHIIGNRDSNKYSRMLTTYRLPIAVFGELLLLVEPLLLGYIVYLSIVNRTFGILLGAYITITLYALWTIWPDEHLNTKQKLRMSFSALGIYLLFYSMDVVQVSAAIKSLANYKLIKYRNGHTTWVSPARSGQHATSIS